MADDTRVTHSRPGLACAVRPVLGAWLRAPRSGFRRRDHRTPRCRVERRSACRRARGRRREATSACWRCRTRSSSRVPDAREAAGARDAQRRPRRALRRAERRVRSVAAIRTRRPTRLPLRASSGTSSRPTTPTSTSRRPGTTPGDGPGAGVDGRGRRPGGPRRAPRPQGRDQHRPGDRRRSTTRAARPPEPVVDHGTHVAGHDRRRAQQRQSASPGSRPARASCRCGRSTTAASSTLDDVLDGVRVRGPSRTSRSSSPRSRPTRCDPPDSGVEHGLRATSSRTYDQTRCSSSPPATRASDNGERPVYPCDTRGARGRRPAEPDLRRHDRPRRRARLPEQRRRRRSTCSRPGERSSRRSRPADGARLRVGACTRHVDVGGRRRRRRRARAVRAARRAPAALLKGAAARQRSTSPPGVGAGASTPPWRSARRWSGRPGGGRAPTAAGSPATRTTTASPTRRQVPDACPARRRGLPGHRRRRRPRRQRQLQRTSPTPTRPTWTATGSATPATPTSTATRWPRRQDHCPRVAAMTADGCPPRVIADPPDDPGRPADRSPPRRSPRPPPDADAGSRRRPRRWSSRRSARRSRRASCKAGPRCKKAAKLTVKLSRTATVSLKVERKQGKKWKRYTSQDADGHHGRQEPHVPRQGRHAASTRAATG